MLSDTVKTLAKGCVALALKQYTEFALAQLKQHLANIAQKKCGDLIIIIINLFIYTLVN